LTACTRNCTQGRHCTCAPVVIKTRHSPLAKLRCWWRLRPLRAELAGLEEDHATVFDGVLNIQAAKFGDDEVAARTLATAMRELLQIELGDISKRMEKLRERIAAIEAAS
jgi:hypothetical protein